jgi:hypothetical protein
MSRPRPKPSRRTAQSAERLRAELPNADVTVDGDTIRVTRDFERRVETDAEKAERRQKMQSVLVQYQMTGAEREAIEQAVEILNERGMKNRLGADWSPPSFMLEAGLELAERLLKIDVEQSQTAKEPTPQ